MNKYDPDAIRRYAEKRLEGNAKWRLLNELGFTWQGDRIKHPSGKLIMVQMYKKMNYDGLVNRLKELKVAA